MKKALGGNNNSEFKYRAVFLFDGYRIQGMSQNVKAGTRDIQTIFVPKNKIYFNMQHGMSTKCNTTRCLWKFTGKLTELSKNIIEVEYELEEMI